MWEYTAFSYAIFWHSLSAFCYCNHWIWFTEDRSGFSLSGQTELICNCSVSIVFKSQIIPVYWTRSPLFSIWTFSLIVWLQLLCILILAIFFPLYSYIYFCFTLAVFLLHLFGPLVWRVQVLAHLVPTALTLCNPFLFKQCLSLYSPSVQVFVCSFFSSKSCGINWYLFSLPSPTGQELQTAVWLPLVIPHTNSQI